MNLHLPPEGTPEREQQDLAVLDHAEKHHGLRSRPCPDCHGEGCGTCGGDGAIYSTPNPRPCGPRCIYAERLVALAKARAS